MPVELEHLVDRRAASGRATRIIVDQLAHRQVADQPAGLQHRADRAARDRLGRRRAEHA